MRDFVVDFRLPFDPLFVHHGANVSARNAREAVALFRRHVPAAQRVTAAQGIVCLCGKPWATWDSSLGAPCRPLSRANPGAGANTPTTPQP